MDSQEDVSEAPDGIFTRGVGMAAALARLHTVTDDREYREAAERALEYERGQFSRENLNWRYEETREVLLDTCSAGVMALRESPCRGSVW